jgi:proline iminopeptidase
MELHVNGTTLYFDVVGAGLNPAASYRQRPTLLILHGGPGFDHTYLRPWLDSVSEVAQLIYIDLRGCGRSQRHSNEYYQLGILADDVVLLCQELAIEHPIVLGQSFGGVSRRMCLPGGPPLPVTSWDMPTPCVPPEPP